MMAQPESAIARHVAPTIRTDIIVLFIEGKPDPTITDTRRNHGRKALIYG
ncbi:MULTISPECIES: hypothetical protein [Sphingobium]|nr:hypothetical protein [Sphingobium sp. YC-XJ3]WDA38683.1 hypothetical protein PO876_11130 [Sphingobium sp. YC-XJ3]